jgi:hypothetical protein
MAWALGGSPLLRAFTQKVNTDAAVDRHGGQAAIPDSLFCFWNKKKKRLQNRKNMRLFPTHFGWHSSRLVEMTVAPVYTIV